MRVTMVADSCMLLETDGFRLLTDPWIGTLAYGDWVQYPPPVITAADVGPLDGIFISHLHPDHCDHATIDALDPTAPILLMERTPNLLQRHLVDHGIEHDRLFLLAPRTPVEIAPGIHVEAIEPNPAHEYSRLVDSALLVHAETGTVYFANDCEPYEGSSAYIADRYDVALAMLPFYGGSSYPACYDNLTDAEKRSEVERIQRAYLASASRALDAISPRWVVPVASWHCYAGAAAPLNWTMSWPTSADQLIEHMEDRPEELVLLSPGQGIDLRNGTRYGGEFRSFSAMDRQRYAESVGSEITMPHTAIPDSPSMRLDRLLAHAADSARERLPGYQFPAGFRYEFDCGEDVTYRLDPEMRLEVRPRGDVLEPPYLRLRMDRRLLGLLLVGALSWNVEDLSANIRYERVPNTYQPEIHVALNYLKI